MRLIEYNEKYQLSWDEFINISKNGTLLNTRKFLSYHKDKWLDKSLLFEENGEIKGVFPACVFENTIYSHLGSSSGGIIVPENNNISNTFKMFELLLEKFSKYDGVIFKKHEYIFDRLPSQEVEYCAFNLGFEVKNIELSTAINTTFNGGLSRNVKSKIKRKSNDIKIVFDDSNYADFYKILIANLNLKYGLKPVHTLEELKFLKSLFPDKYLLVNAYNNEAVVASVLLNKINNLHAQYISLDYNYKSYYPVYKLINYIVDYCKNQKISFFNLGISTTHNGTKPNMSLFSFKESFNGFGVSRYQYSYKY